MPATLLSHQALVLPLKMRWPRWFSGLGLCLGSMAPDLEFIVRMSDDWVVSHTLTAQLYFTVPVCLGLAWVLTAIVWPAVLPYVADHPWLRVRDLAALTPPQRGQDWLRLALSALLGGISHVLLDGITHGQHSGWLVPHLPFLRTVVPHPGGPVPLHDALQLWLTLLFGAATVGMWWRIAKDRLIWRWRAQAARDVSGRPWWDGTRLLAGTSLAAIPGAMLGLAIHAPTTTKATAAAVAFGAIDAAFVALVLVALWVRRDGRGERRRSAGWAVRQLLGQGDHLRPTSRRPASELQHGHPGGAG